MEPKKVKVIISVIVVLTVLVFSSIGYFVGKGTADGSKTSLTEIEDSSAAVYDSVQKGNVYYSKPQYLPVNESFPLYFRYTGVSNSNELPDWKITFCGKITRFNDMQEVAVTRKFNSAGSCKITVVVNVNGKSESVVFSQKVLKVRKNVDTEILTFGEAYVGEEKAVGVSLENKVDKGYKSFDWNWSVTGVCEAVRNLSIQTDSVFVVLPQSEGVCSFKLVAFVFYDTYAIRVEETKNLTILPSRVVPTEEEDPTESPVPTIVPSVVLPTISGTPVQSPVVSPTIIINPAALSLSPASNKVVSNSEFKVTILAQPPYNTTAKVTAYGLRLKVQGGTIVENSYVPASGNLLTVGACSIENVMTKADEVCVDVASTSGPIANNQILGSFTVKAQSMSPINISTTSKYSYVLNGEERIPEEIVNLANYSVVLP